MKFMDELFEGGTKSAQKKKKTTFYVICVTLALIAVMLIVLAVFGIAMLISDAAEDAEGNSQTPKVTIGATELTQFESDGVHSGNLLRLERGKRAQGDISTVIIRGARVQTEDGANIYSVRSSGSTDELDFRGTPEAVEALNLMMKDFYGKTKDDNLCISKAYTLESKDSIHPIYSSATSFLFECYYGDDYTVRSIYGVDKYNWIYENAYKYGFINVEDPTADEDSEGSTVFRYVGVPHATYMRTKKLTLEEYLEQIKTATPDAPILTSVGKTTYASYYLAADGEHLVPSEHSYTVSGNNTDGYIVTVSIQKG